MVLIWVLGRFILCKRGIEDMCVLESHKTTFCIRSTIQCLDKFIHGYKGTQTI